MAAILTFAFAFGSAMYAFSNKYILVGVVLLFYIIIQKLLHWHRRQKFMHQTMIQCGGKNFRLNALLDSGNALTDPVSGRPVSMLSQPCSRRDILCNYNRRQTRAGRRRPNSCIRRGRYSECRAGTSQSLRWPGSHPHSS